MGYRKVPRFQISLVYKPILSSGCLWKLPHPGHCCNVMSQHQQSVDYVIIVSLAYYNYPKCDTRYYSLYQRINVCQHSLATALKALSCFKISCLNFGASVPSLWRLQRRWTVHLNTVVWKAGTVLLQLCQVVAYGLRSVDSVGDDRASQGLVGLADGFVVMSCSGWELKSMFTRNRQAWLIQ